MILWKKNLRVLLAHVSRSHAMLKNGLLLLLINWRLELRRFLSWRLVCQHLFNSRSIKMKACRSIVLIWYCFVFKALIHLVEDQHCSCAHFERGIEWSLWQHLFGHPSYWRNCQLPDKEIRLLSIRIKTAHESLHLWNIHTKGGQWQRGGRIGKPRFLWLLNHVLILPDPRIVYSGTTLLFPSHAYKNDFASSAAMFLLDIRCGVTGCQWSIEHTKECWNIHTILYCELWLHWK
jgi:hypothetical protein